MPRTKLRTPDLREELLQRAVAVLEHEGPVALRARRVASAAGTSTGALYELFGDKTGLVRAIFYEGFRMLAERLEEVAITAHRGQEGNRVWWPALNAEPSRASSDLGQVRRRRS